MAKGLSVSVVSDTREFVSGIQSGVIKPLENVEQSLEDVQRQGDQAGAKLEQSFAEARTKVSDFKREQSELGKVLSDGSAQTRFSRNTKKATDEASDDFKQLARDANRSLDDIGDGSRRTLGHGGVASETTEEFKNEARQNFGETVSSFSGSMSDIQGLAQGTLGGLAASFTGPLGIALGAGGIGLGILAGFYEQWQEKQKETDEANKQDVADMLDDMLQSGQKFLSAEFIQQRIQDIANDSDKWAQANTIVADTGAKLSTVLRAMAGDQEALDEVQGRVNKKLDDNAAILQAGTGKWSDAGKAAEEHNQALLKDRDALQQVSGELDTATGKLGAVKKAQDDVGDSSTNASGKLAGVANAANSIPDTKHITVTADTTAAERQIAALKAQVPQQIQMQVLVNSRRGVAIQ
jgi:hypothetical protein